MSMKSAQNLKQSWDRIAARLRAELGEDLYSSWFARMEAEECQDRQLAVSVPTRFLKNWIESHYAARLQKISETEFGALDGVAIRVRSRGLPVRPQAETERREPAEAQPAACAWPLTSHRAPPFRPSRLAMIAARRSIIHSPSRISCSAAPMRWPMPLPCA